VSIYDSQTTIQFSKLSKICSESWIKVLKQSWPQQELNPGPLTLQPDALPLHHRALHVKLEKIEGYEVPSSSLFAEKQYPHFVSIYDSQTTIQFSELSKI